MKEEVLQRLQQLKARRKEFQSLQAITDACKNDTQLRNEIRYLYKQLYHKSLSGCVDCYADAFVELVNQKA